MTVNQSAVGVNSAGGAVQLTSNHQDDLTSRYQSPVSIAAGAAYTFSSTSLYLSLEWFGPAAEYDVLETQDFVPQTPGEPISISLTQKRSPVLNYGIGIHYKLSSLFSLYGSFLADRSYLPEGYSSPVNFAAYDLNHITGGVSLSIPTLELTVGVAYAFGKGTYETFRPVLQYGTSPTLISGAVPVEVEYNRLGFVVGFTLRL